ncbi:MAG: phage holin family protein [Bacteroidaceae bacterium]|nr:phage holin family protein [Bacteroides sp.]MBQ3609484.1 phage holin family protein [Bacteroidaceae bacterium]MBQ8769995.1 phage holin family protein [Bacteroides sp.]MBR4044208.1 phage holin family protein [Bacteroidaceae bacterium]
MFSTDKTIDNLQTLFTEVKHYVDLQKDYVKLDITHKLTILLSTLILILVLVVLGMIALFYLSFTLAYVLEPLVGGLTTSYAIITGGILLLGALIYGCRQRLIIQPLTNFLANLLLNDK